MTRRLILTTLVLAALWGAEPAAAADPGRVDFGDLSAISDKDPTVEISLGQALLGFLCEAVREEDAELAETLCNLRTIRISVFDLGPNDYEAAKARAEAISEQLEADDWEPAVKMRAEDATVRMYMKMNGGVVAGMAVMVIEPGSDAVFMNIVGEIDPRQLGRVAAKFGVDLDDLKVE